MTKILRRYYCLLEQCRASMLSRQLSRLAPGGPSFGTSVNLTDNLLWFFWAQSGKHYSSDSRCRFISFHIIATDEFVVIQPLDPLVWYTVIPRTARVLGGSNYCVLGKTALRELLIGKKLVNADTYWHPTPTPRQSLIMVHLWTF